MPKPKMMNGYDRLALACELTTLGVCLSDAAAIALSPDIHTKDEGYEMLGSLAAMDAMNSTDSIAA